MNYDVLKNELENDPLGIGYSVMSDEQAAEALNSATRTVVYSRFCSLRAIAAVLSDVEYAQLKSDLATLSAASPRIADMVHFLELPCDDSGNTGGLDIGNAEVRALIDALPTLTAEGKNKIKALAERTIRRVDELGLSNVGPHHIAFARSIMQ